MVGQCTRLTYVGIVRHTVDEEPFVVLVVPDSFPAFWDPGWWWALCTLAACRSFRTSTREDSLLEAQSQP